MPRGPFDRALYRERQQVERLINRLKPCRRVATRYEKRAANYLAMGDCSGRSGIETASGVEARIRGRARGAVHSRTLAPCRIPLRAAIKAVRAQQFIAAAGCGRATQDAPIRFPWRFPRHSTQGPPEQSLCTFV